VRVHVIANDGDADPGLVARRLREREPSTTFTTLIRERHDEWPRIGAVRGGGGDATPPDLLLILGSAWSVHWSHLAREVAAECALIRRAHDAGTPILGICYGAQITARALGGDAMPAARPEIGWCAVDVVPPATTPAGSGATRRRQPISGEWFQWHVDTFAPPPGATVLATSPAGPQAYRLGRTFATQFHPEVTSEMVARWAADTPADATDDAPARLGVHPADLVAATRAREPGNAAAAARLVDWYLDTVAAAAR